MEPRTRQIVVLALAAVAVLALAGAFATVLLAPDDAPTLLVACLGVLVLVLLAEVVVVVLGRREMA